MSNHTPWKFNGVSILDKNGDSAMTKANAPLIVKAVNHHDELVAALRACHNRLSCHDEQSVPEMLLAESVLAKLEETK